VGAAEKLEDVKLETADPAVVVDLAQYKRRRSRAALRIASGRSHLRYEPASGPCSYLFDGIDHPLRIARPGASTNFYYYEVDLAGNVRGLRASGGASLGGYRYSAFGQTLEDTSMVTQPLRWKGRWFSPVAGGTYDVRARQWSPELGVFLEIDEFAYQDNPTTLWGWPGMAPSRWRDPSGHRKDACDSNDTNCGGYYSPAPPDAPPSPGTFCEAFPQLCGGPPPGGPPPGPGPGGGGGGDQCSAPPPTCPDFGKASTACSEECTLLMGQQPRKKKSQGAGGTNTQFQFQDCFDDCMRFMGCK
jgi:RHS repeat-associated protein